MFTTPHYHSTDSKFRRRGAMLHRGFVILLLATLGSFEFDHSCHRVH